MNTYRVQLGDCRVPCSKPVNLCSSDTTGKLVSYINRACSRLLHGDLHSGSGKWPSVCMKYSQPVSTSTIALPRDIEVIEVWSLDKCPRDIRNQWYPYLPLGLGVLDKDADFNGWQLVDDGEQPALIDVATTGHKLAVKPDVTEDANASISLRFLGTNSEKVRTENPPGTFIEGENILLPAAGNYTVTANGALASGLYQVVKPITKGVVRLYEFDGASTYTPLAAYEPSETIPAYRRYVVPGMNKLTGTHTITAIGKVRHIPAINDSDMVQIPLVESIRLGCQAVFLEEGYHFDDAAKCWQMAYFTLHSQLAHFHGTGVQVPMKMQNCETWGAGGVGCMR